VERAGLREGGRGRAGLVRDRLRRGRGRVQAATADHGEVSCRAEGSSPMTRQQRLAMQRAYRESPRGVWPVVGTQISNHFLRPTINRVPN